jgi:hypothetical protein
MKRARDFQRKRVYELDKCIGGVVDIDTDKEELSLETIETWITSILNRYDLGKCPVIKDCRGCRAARGGKYLIVLPRWSRNRVIVAHELAHCITQRLFNWQETPAHGNEFVGIYKEVLLVMTNLLPIQFDYLCKQMKVSYIDMSSRFKERKIA